MQGKTPIPPRRLLSSVGQVISGGPPERCYLVEWYQSDLLTQPMDDAVAQLDSAAGAERGTTAPVQLLATVAAPTDEVLYGLFTADSADTVSRVCQRAGWPADRITARIDARFQGSPC